VTKRLYYQDPYLRAFDANVVESRQLDDQTGIVLDATAFYPTGGGQPHDTGTLNGARVLGVLVADDGQIIHVLDRSLAQATVRGEVDWERRFDHMQQHTGQHILSQAFVQICQADTVGFHLGESVSTIDVDRAPLGASQVAGAEKLANEVTLGNHDVIARFADVSELATMPLRKLPAVDGPIRIVQVARFDWSPCGGTHVRNSGQVGSIKVMRVERRKKVTRIHFLCGWRAFYDYAQKQEIVQALATCFTTSESEIVPSVQRMEARGKDLRRALTSAQMQLLEYEIADWVSRAQLVGEMQVVRLTFDDRDLPLLREIARRLTEGSGTVALLANRQPRVQFVFASSEDVAVDMGSVMRAACASVGGRGGGSPRFAQGGAPEGSAADKALDEATEQLRAF